MNQLRRTHCGTVGPDPGFVEDTGRGSFGFAKSRGRPRWQVDAFRCPNCAHLELFAVTQA